MLSLRVSVRRTGRAVRVARRAAWHWTFRSSLAPNAPPVGTCVTRTRSSGTPRNEEIWRRSSQTPCPCEKTSRRPSPPGTASDDSGSRKACSMNCVLKDSLTTCAAPARAASTSPRSTRETDSTFPPSCSSGAPSASDWNGSVTGSSTSYSTSTSAAAVRAAWRVSAATAAITSPTYAVTSPSATSWRQSRLIEPWTRSPGTSAAVTTATTPGSARAFETSIRRIRARGWSENRRAPWSMPGATMSPTKTLSPRARSVPW